MSIHSSSEAMTSAERQQELVETCFAGIVSDEPLSRLIERAIRLAEMRRDRANAWWLRLKRSVSTNGWRSLRSMRK